MVDAQTKMKALVVSRLLLGDMTDWKSFETERETARKIVNRRTARSVSSQIGRKYRDLSSEMRHFIERNFARCGYDDLARLCDEVKSGFGLYARLDEFERKFFPLAEPVKRRFPFYAHVVISTYGLQFEFPEHHFMGDLDAAFELLKETREQMRVLPKGRTETEARDAIARLVGQEKFISRSMVSASFSLVEAFLSGLFFTALHLNSLGRLPCNGEMLTYAKHRESASLKDRIDRIVKFASAGKEDGQSGLFKSFIEVGKRYRDAIHHTTPFERKDLEAGQRLIHLYEVKSDVALFCTLLSLAVVLKISRWIYGEDSENDIMERCLNLNEKISIYSIRQGLAKVEKESLSFELLTKEEEYGAIS
jgi:hypothetical protein